MRGHAFKISHQISRLSLRFLYLHRLPRPALYVASRSFTMDPIIQSLAALSIKATVTHRDVDSPAAWRDALTSTAGTPESFELIKTLVFKPKTAKSATPVPVVVVAREETETNSGALGKKLNLKELRLANEDLLKDFFSLDKNSRESRLSSRSPRAC